MKQPEFNAVLNSAAEMIAALPIGYDDHWWGSANLSFREHLALEHMQMFEAMAKRLNLKFNRATFLRASLPKSDIQIRKVLASDDFEMFMGIWTRNGVDPYATGQASALAVANDSASVDMMIAAQFAGGVASVGSAT